MSDVQNTVKPCRIIDPVCSCGREIGSLQHIIEFRMVEKSNYGDIHTDDTTLSEILDELDITRVCCRKTIILSPVCRLIQVGPTQRIIDLKRDRFNNKILDHLSVNPDY